MVRTEGEWPRGHSPHLYLLPYLGHNAIYDQCDLQVVAHPGYSNAPDVNGPLMKRRISMFLCPSDSKRGLNNFRVNIGVTAFPRDPNVPQSTPRSSIAGAFYPVQESLGPQAIVDGLSFTVAFSERLAGDASPQSFHKASDFFDVSYVEEWLNLSNSTHADNRFAEACGSLRDPRPPHRSEAGYHWFYAGLANTWYNHLLSPNHPIPDCGVVDGIFGGAVMSARSSHVRGVNVVMLDGHIRFVEDGVQLAVWQAMGTRAGREAIHSR